MVFRGKRKSALFFKIGVVVCVASVYALIGLTTRGLGGVSSIKTQEATINGRHLLSMVPNTNCTPPALNEFPSDGLTREQRQHGWILLHVLTACYLFILLALVCDDYFVPAIKEICEKLHMREDIAGATFMAVASSSPELFINSVGTFITEGDLGVGTIVGSAVFNVLAVPACCGLFGNMVIQLEWWPITRDCSVYGVSVIMLITVLIDGNIELYDAIMLILTYVAYLIIMYFNEPLSNMFTRLSRKFRRKRGTYQEILMETQPLLNGCHKNGNGFLTIPSDAEITLKDCEELEQSTNIWKWPDEHTTFKKCWWIFTWPISFVLSMTTPDCRKYPKLTPITFLMCIFWIGTTSYAVAWFITIIGDTLSIPDSVMGLTFLAAGTSVPEAVSSIIVTNQGHGSMGVSSSIASNTFDILLCLGIPWLIKTWFYPKVPGDHSITINSSGIAYSSISLLSTLLIFYLSLVLNKFRLDWKIGVSCLLLYLIFLCMASLIELNVFYPVNLPTCDR